MNEYYTGLAKRIASGDLSPKDLILWQKMVNLKLPMVLQVNLL